MNSLLLPVSKNDLAMRKWPAIEVLLVSPDPYIDHPSFGLSVLGRVLEDRGYRVGIVAQPDWKQEDDFVKLGRPELWCGISGGTVDSVLANYTVNRKKRRDDAFGPGGKGGLRPTRASIVYANIIRSCFPGLPIVLGGIEASTRRFAHYDWWDNKIRRSILFDSRADLVVWGEGELTALHITALLLKGKKRLWGIPGTAIRVKRTELDEVLVEAGNYFRIEDLPFKGDSNDLSPFPEEKRGVRFLPGFNELCAEKGKLIELSKIVERETRGFAGDILVQAHGDHVVVSFPRSRYLTQKELDEVSELPYTRSQKPGILRAPALSSIQTSVITHRGCPGGCTFCAISIHSGRTIRSRSSASILREIGSIAGKSFYGGTISDLGGPTANLYGMGCKDPDVEKRCSRPSCLWPDLCSNFRVDPDPLQLLLKKVRELRVVKHAFIASGIRYDVLLRSPRLLAEIFRYHIGGRMKVAPEHAVDRILKLMRKPGIAPFKKIVKEFRKYCKKEGRKDWIIPYFISSFPGSTDKDAWEVKCFLEGLELRADQVQDFWPTPLTLGAAMYWAEKDLDGHPVYVAKSHAQRARQKACLRYHDKRNNELLKTIEKDIQSVE